jgi:hypothetical protein
MIGNMDGWNLALLAVAGYIAVVTLARLMLRRRNQMMQRFREEVAKEKVRRAVARKSEPKSSRDRAA